MAEQTKREFHAVFTPEGYRLVCRRCETVEQFGRSSRRLHDIAALHARWFHFSPVMVADPVMLTRAASMNGGVS